MTNEQAITSQIEAWVAAVRAREIDGVLAAHADDQPLFGPQPFDQALIERTTKRAR